MADSMTTDTLKKLPVGLQRDFMQLTFNLRRRTLLRTTDICCAVGEFLLGVIHEFKYNHATSSVEADVTVQDLVSFLLSLSSSLQEAAPYELSIGNICRRVIQRARCIRETTGATCGAFFERHFTPSQPLSSQPYTSIERSRLLSRVQKIVSAVHDDEEALCDCAEDFASTNETVLLVGYHPLAVAFLAAAAANGAAITALVTENLPRRDGLRAVTELKAAGVSATMIPDATVATAAARCTRLLIVPHAVLINGGVVAQAGTSLAAHAANFAGVPVHMLVLTHLLSTRPPGDPRELTTFAPPQLLGDPALAPANGALEVVYPLLDYTDPGLVSVLWTPQGTVGPSYLGRLMQEEFAAEDY